jgi:uncharacterized membrane protein YkgB
MDEEEKGVYTEERAVQIELVYIVAIVFWLFIVTWFVLYETDGIGFIILAIPVVIFLTGYINSHVLSEEVEKENFQANYFAIGLLIIIPLLTWMNKEYTGDKRRFTSILVLAIIIVLLSLLDVWVSKEYLSVTKHVKSALQTIALTLFIYALYCYYLHNPHCVFC